MIYVWLILALGVFFFLVLVGSGLERYLSTKNDVKEDKDEPVSREHGN